MESFDDKLKRAMGRANPPEEFTERVMAAISQRSVRRQVPRHSGMPLFDWLFGLRWRPVFAAALVVVFGAGFFMYWQRRAASNLEQERARGDQIRAELLMALSITGTHLARVHELLAAGTTNEPISAAEPAAH